MPQNTAKIDVIDMPMGAGKTNGMIAYMNAHPENKYLFVTPYRTERKRIQDACPSLNFFIPDNEYSKLTECQDFILQGENIATTHALFSRFNSETMSILRQQEYILIIDEEPDCIFEILSMSTDDYQMLANGGYIELSEQDKQLFIVEYNQYSGVVSTYRKMRDYIDSRNFYLVDDLNYDTHNIGIIGVMKPEIFTCFKQIFLLTYLFRDSNYDCYCRFWNIEYCNHYFDGENLEEGGFDDREFRRTANSLINLLEHSKLNFREYDVNKNPDAVTLSKSWYRDATNGGLRRIKRNASNYVRNKMHSRQAETMWSTYKDWKDEMSGNGCYARSFVPCNCRATNQYRNKKTLVYLLNLYPNPFLIRWLNKNGITVNQDHFPLTMLLQWVFRSQIRDGKEINLYLPAFRMREILKRYLAD